MCAFKTSLFHYIYRFLFWTDYTRVRRMNLATGKKVTLTSSGSPWDISLDLKRKRVYWLTEHYGIFSSTYDDRSIIYLDRYYAIRSSTFDGSRTTFGISEDSVYFQRTDVPYINEMNISSSIISRNIKVDTPDYRDLVIVHSSLQPIGELQ